jgi:GNAT superfamily N-acetyltransferase
VTRRANSTLAIGAEGSVEELVAASERFYASRWGAPCIQVSDASAPPMLTDYLLRRGYVPSPRVMTMRISAQQAGAETERWPVSLRPVPTDDWFLAFWRVESNTQPLSFAAQVYRNVLLRPSVATWFAAVEADGETIGVCQLVVRGQLAVFQSAATAPERRSQGVFSSIFWHVARQATQMGANELWCAVEEENRPARRLYEHLGFSEKHAYRYFSLP